MSIESSVLSEVARCPRCLAGIVRLELPDPSCSNSECELSKIGFIKVAGQPVLIDFGKSIFQVHAYGSDRGHVMPRDYSGRSLGTRLRRFITGANLVAKGNGQEFLKRVKEISMRPKVLVIGGGAIGAGAEGLYGDTEVDVVSTDVYASPFTCAVVDGHNLPFCAEGFDGVWIQAVLEHVLEPHVVAEEIFRVLKPRGLVYSEIPFMQQVHEGAYDFTRFTLSGHRWLFRRFEQLNAGVVSGAATALVWSFRYLCRALGASDKVATLLSLPVFWLQYLDRFTRRRPNADGASGTFFLGVKSDRAIIPGEMVSYYETQKVTY